MFDIQSLFTSITLILSVSPILTLLALGFLITAKTGVFNVGTEGITALGASVGIIGYFVFGDSIVMGLLSGFIVGIVVGAIIAILTIHLDLDQLVVGFGIWFATEGLAPVLYFLIVPPFFHIQQSFPSFLNLDAFFYLVLFMFVIYYIIIKKTKMGLHISTAGENPKAGDVLGINIYKLRWIFTLIGSGLMGLAGAYFSVVVLGEFYFLMVAGYGWLAMMVVIFGRFKVSSTYLSAIFFSLLIGIQTRMQVSGFSLIPVQFMIVMPYIGAMIVLIITAMFGKKAGAPKALGKHYKRE